MFKTLLCDENHQFLVIEDPDQISEIVQNRERMLWLDLENPSAEELHKIGQEFNFHPLAIEDASKRHQRPKVDQYADFYFVVFYTIAYQHEKSQEVLVGRRGLRGAAFHMQANGFPSAGEEVEEEATSDSGGMPGSDGAAKTPTGMITADDERVVTRELALFLGKNYLVTIHEDNIPELDDAAKRWFRNVEEMEVPVARARSGNGVRGARPLLPNEKGSLQPGPETAGENGPQAGRNAAPGHAPAAPHAALPQRIADMAAPGQSTEDGADGKHGSGQAEMAILLYSLLDTIVDSYFPVVDSIVDRVEGLEEQIFEQFNQDALQEVFRLKKDLLALRKVLAPERDVLNVLTRRDLPIFDQATILYFQDVYDHVVRITDSIDTYRDLLSSALDSYLSMQSNRLNITVQTLTSVSIILMSIATITGWYGMNFEVMPELHSALGYPGVVAAVLFIVGLEATYFKRKGWL